MNTDIIRNITLFDGETFREATCDVTLTDGVIAAIDEVDAASTGTVLPGFIDSHVHVGFHSPAALARNGVTAALDLGWPIEGVRALATQPGASIRFAGPILTAPGGYPIGAPWAPPGTGRGVSSPDEAKAVVDELVEAGASIVKIAQEPREGSAVLDDETLEAIVSAAHARNRLVASHVGSAGELMRALASGVDVLAHGMWSDEPLPADALVAMSEVIVVPTLRIAPTPARLAATRRLVEQGITIVYGTDLGNPPTTPGIDAEELALMRTAGLRLEEALASATAIPAARFGWGPRGRIAPGMRADLVRLGGDPRTDPGALGRIEQVWLAGELQR